jgi:Ser/Thr protein kinase RdoA (MazF antagonist)
LATHLVRRYGIQVTGVTELDRGVYRVDRPDGPAWVARVFGPERPAAQVDGDAAILRALQRAGFPAERCADPEPVSTVDGRAVLVTEFVTGTRAAPNARTFAVLGALLGRLHTRAADGLRAGGAWHHIVPAGGGPRAEIDAALAALPDTAEYGPVREGLVDADDGADLPHAFVHPDFVPANAITMPDGGMVIVDWTGAGRGPRIWPLAFLLWAAARVDGRMVDVAFSRYRRHVELEPAELDRLGDVLRVRPLVMDCWSIREGRLSAEAALRNMSVTDAIAARVSGGGRTVPDMTDTPLCTLLSQVWIAVTVEMDNEFEHRMAHRTTRGGSRSGPWLVASPMWYSCLRYVTDDGITVAELARLAGTGTNLGGMLRWGYVMAELGPRDRDPNRPGPQAVLRPTPAGRKAREVWAEVFDVVEGRWRERFDADRLRAALSAVAASLDPALPDCLPIIGIDMVTRTRVLDREPPTGPLSLATLLARVLLAFTIEVETGSEPALALRQNVLRVLADAPVLVRDLPGLSGVSREAIDTSLTFLTQQRYVVVEPAPSRGKQVRLTDRGRTARDATGPALAAVEARWRDRFGGEVIDELRAVLTPIAGWWPRPYPDGWRATIRHGDTVPHFPMVLHRGGYPDGS